MVPEFGTESTEDSDYRTHAEWFLGKLQRLIDELRLSKQFQLDESVVRFEKLWPQVANAFGWASSQTTTSPDAVRLANAFSECAMTDNLVQFARTPAELREWGEAVLRFASRAESVPEAAELVRHFGERTMMQGEQLIVVRDTRNRLNDLLSEIIQTQVSSRDLGLQPEDDLLKKGR